MMKIKYYFLEVNSKTAYFFICRIQNALWFSFIEHLI